MSEESLFHAALAKLPAERAAFLEQACAGQPQLRATVEALLAAHEGSGSLLNRPPVALPQTLDPDPEQLEPAPPPFVTTANYQPPIEPGIVIAGRYKLVEKIGEGGMGEVWVAKQTEPIKRKVAIKLIKSGMGSRSVLQRFEQERQVLALMDHPNIARIFDGGLTSDCRPFFVMELVHGMPLIRFCDDARLGIRERLELFASICQAVQHAHQKGIIHRDLKPSNLLVTLLDGKPVPKVIDFGVAKAAAGSFTDVSLSTQFGAVVGTLEYMAPEQAGLAGADVDTRADIYSLGVILYELLTGLRPIDAKRLKKAAFDEMIRILKEEDPSKPSTRLSTDEAAPSLAALRQTEPKKLMALLRGELDWVVMKCLEKQRDRRYETANALCRDVQRYLADEAVEARPPSVGYRLSKFLKRNKGPVVAASLLLLALVAGIAGTTLGMLRADQALAAEAEHRTKAEQARDRTRQVLDAMTSSIAGDSLTTQRELSEEQKKFLREVLTYYQEFAGEKADDEPSRARTAAAAYRVGLIEYRLGRKAEAAAAFRLACDGYEKLVADFPTVPAYRRELAASHNRLGARLADLGKRPEAEQQYRKALGIFQQLATDFPAESEYSHEVAASHLNLGILLAAQGNRREAEQQYRQAFAIEEKLTVEFPAVPQYRQKLANCHNNLGILLADLGKRPEAEQQYRKALAIHEKLVADFPAVPQYRHEVAACQNNLGILLAAQGKGPEAEQQYRQALIVQEKLVADFPAEPEYRQKLANSHNSLGALLAAQGKRPEAEQQYRQAHSIYEKLAADFPAVPEYRIALGGSSCNFGHLLRMSGRPSESLVWFDEAIRTLKATYDQDRPLVVAKQYLRNSYGGRALVYDRLQKYAEAANDLDRAVELSPKAEQNSFRAARALARVKAGQVVGAVAEVAELTQMTDWKAREWYDFACVYALASGKSAEKKQEYADRAMDLLNKAVKAGYTNAAHVKIDTDLDTLRGRRDFKKLLAELEKKAATKPEKKP